MRLFTLLLIMFSMFANAMDCSLPEHVEDCATVSIKIKKAALKKMQFDANGLAGTSVGNLGCFWVKKSGEARKTHCFDNGADEFVNGLARYVDDSGLFGYMNTKLNVVIPAKYTFGHPFKNGEAWVCNGCKIVKAQDSEHSMVEGGEWFVINTKGKVIKQCAKAFDYPSCKK